MSSVRQAAYMPEKGTADSSAVEKSAYQKITWRIIPFLMLGYVIAYLDRTSVSFAQIQMQQDLGFSAAVYGLGAGIFFIGYSLFEVPSNLLLQRVGVKKTLFRILILWGAAATGMMFVQTPMQFYVMRFLLGVFEAGFTPGVFYYLTKWYPGARRGTIISFFLLGMPISGVLGGPIAGWALGHLNGVGGWAGWQWLFFIEGLPAIIMGILVLWVITDEPAKAKWLTEAERAVVIHNVKVEHSQRSLEHGRTIGTTLRDPRVYILSLAYFTFIAAIYAIGFWLPAMLKDAGVSDVFDIGLYSAIPFGLSALGMVLISRSSDLRLERRWHLAGCAFVGAISLACIPIAHSNLFTAILVMSIATIAIYTLLPLLWSIVSSYVAGTVAAPTSIALINSLGLIGGLASPVIIGWVKTTTGSLNNGLFAISIMLVLGAIILLTGIKASHLQEIPSR